MNSFLKESDNAIVKYQLEEYSQVSWWDMNYGVDTPCLACILSPDLDASMDC
jgi:hypothetical protein